MTDPPRTDAEANAQTGRKGLRTIYVSRGAVAAAIAEKMG